MSGSADPRSLLAAPVTEVAPRLLGAVLRHGGVAVRLTEVEAYDGADDPGSHAFRGRTPRNATMFGPPGHLYVYFTYGMHHCCNVVCGQEGSASGVLLRAGEVVDGLALARERRRGAAHRELARGPARMCTALGIGRESDGADLLAAGEVRLELADRQPTGWEAGPRVGLRAAADRPWRFWLPGEPSVSQYRPAAPLRRRARPAHPDLGRPPAPC